MLLQHKLERLRIEKFKEDYTIGMQKHSKQTGVSWRTWDRIEKGIMPSVRTLKILQHNLGFRLEITPFLIKVIK